MDKPKRTEPCPRCSSIRASLSECRDAGAPMWLAREQWRLVLMALAVVNAPLTLIYAAIGPRMLARHLNRQWCLANTVSRFLDDWKA